MSNPSYYVTYTIAGGYVAIGRSTACVMTVRVHVRQHTAVLPPFVNFAIGDPVTLSTNWQKICALLSFLSGFTNDLKNNL